MKILAMVEGFFDGAAREAGEVFEAEPRISALPAGMMRLPDDVPAPARGAMVREVGGYVRVIAQGRIIYPIADALADVTAHLGDDA